ncbi:LGFP repeat-containing protein [Corynebacterium hindlerae]|uniref:LGFP repeat-containing protein n=1 Tax=Corynebacterium hindlerae TaxID=699041 RepID=UPI0031B6D903
MLATVCLNPIPAHGQEIDQSANEAVAADISQLRHPAERDIYDVDTSDWDFNEPGMNKNNIDNHYYEHTLPTDLGKPQPQIIDGQMRSDRIALPDTVTKHEADQAEVMEANEQQPQLRAMAADNCRTYWPRPHQVCGAIREKYESLAVAWAGQTPLSFLGLPKSGELTNPDGVGKRTEFDNGFIYWHPNTGAWSVTTHNSIVWARNGWEQGRLGYPTSDEIGTGDNVGRKQSFQRGRIYTSLSGVVSIEGKILEKWIETGEEKGPLGYPATDEEGTPDGVGRFNRFARGMIYWHPKHGAHPIQGSILEIWKTLGFERSRFGYPTGDPFHINEYESTQDFEGGSLNPLELFTNAGTELIDGKEFNSFVIELLTHNGVLRSDIPNLQWTSDPFSTALQFNQRPSSATPLSIKRPWNTCGVFDDAYKVIRTWTARFGLLAGKTVKLECGDWKGAKFGYRHIKREHTTHNQWEYLYTLDQRMTSWEELADLAITKSLTNAEYWKHQEATGKTCYTSPVYLIDRRTNELAMVIFPSIIASANNARIITAFPGDRCAGH